MKNSSSKIRIWLMLGLSLLAVGVTSLSTMAWFQLQLGSETVSGVDTVAGSPNINVGRIKGYKYEYDEPEKGAIDYSSGDVTSVTTKNTFEQFDITEDMEAVEYDIPTSGTGYYLMGDSKWVAGYNARYSKNLDTTKYAYKFKASEKLIEKSVYPGESYSNVMYYKKNVYIGANGTEIGIKKHFFNSGSTKNSVVTFTVDSTYSKSLINEATPTNVSAVTIKSSGYYNFWFNDDGYLGIEEAFSANSKNRSLLRQNSNNDSANWGEATKKMAQGSTGNTDYTKIILNDANYDSDGYTSWCFHTLWISNITYSSGYNADSFDYFCSQHYGSKLNDWTNQKQRETAAYYRYDSNGSNVGFNLATTISSHQGTFYLPLWVTNCSIHIENSSNSIKFNDLNNLYTSSGKKDSLSYHTNTNSFNAYGKTVTFRSRKYHNYDNSGKEGDEGNYSGYNNWDSLVITVNIADNSGDKSWDTNYINVKYVDNNGSNISAFSSYVISNSLQIAVNNYSVPASNPTTSGYVFSSWYYSRSNSFASKTSTTASAGIQVQDGFTIYCVYDVLWTITLSAKFYLSDGTTPLSGIDITDVSDFSGNTLETTTKYYDGDTTFSESSTLTGTYQYYDDINCIWYVFDRDNSSTWYKNDGTAYSGKPGTDMTLFAKFLAKPLATIYADIKDTQYTWTGLKFHAWGTWNDSYEHSRTETGKCFINSKFYRFTIPSNCTGYIIQDGNNTGGDKQTTNVTTITDGSYLRAVGNGSKTNNKWFLDGDVSRSGGTLWVSRKADSYATAKFEPYPMGNAEALAVSTTNLAALENGLILYAGDLLVVNYDVYTGGQHYYWHDTLESSYDYAERVTTSIPGFEGFNGGEQTTVIRITKTGRYTFYFKETDGRHNIAIAQTPLDGNGYYVMTSATNQYGTFDNSHKMKTITSGDSTNRAYLKNLYIAEDCYVYMRSYNDNVDLGPGNGNDTRYTGRIGETGTYTQTVFIDITTPGYYNVYAFYKTNTHTEDNLRFSIVETDERSTFFTLNSLSSHDSKTIKEQNTSLIMEAAFKITSVDSTQISVQVNNSFSNVGSYAICTPKKLKDPYRAMRAAIYDGGYTPSDAQKENAIASSSLSSGNHRFTNLCTTDANDPGKVYYVYVMFDYFSKGNPLFPSGSMSFFIESTQRTVS